MRKLKILFIGTSDNQGGAAHVGWDIGQWMISQGHDVKYIVGRKSSGENFVYETKKYEILEKLKNLLGKDFNLFFSNMISFVFSNDIDRGASSEITEHPWYKNADIVHCHNLHGNYFKLDTLCKIANEKSTIWTLHDGWALTAHCAYCFDCPHYNNGKHFTPGTKRYQAMLWDNSDYLWNRKKVIYENCLMLNTVTPSAWLSKIVNKSILENKLSSVINNGIDTNIFKPGNVENAREKLNIPQDKTVITFVAHGGKLDVRKGGNYFLNISKHYENDVNMLMICIGGGYKYEQKGNILYVPFIKDRKELAVYYQASNVFLFTSLAENFPLVTLEALATGLPIVSFNVGGVGEQIRHKINGYLAKYKSNYDLTKGIEYILNLDKKQIDLMKSNNRKIVLKKYTIPIMAKQYLNLYNSIINK